MLMGKGLGGEAGIIFNLQSIFRCLEHCNRLEPKEIGEAGRETPGRGAMDGWNDQGGWPNIQGTQET
jgi:hypothetical protein